jgi:hypothetical protein
VRGVHFRLAGEDVGGGQGAFVFFVLVRAVEGLVEGDGGVVEDAV